MTALHRGRSSRRGSYLIVNDHSYHDLLLAVTSYFIHWYFFIYTKNMIRNIEIWTLLSMCKSWYVIITSNSIINVVLQQYEWTLGKLPLYIRIAGKRYTVDQFFINDWTVTKFCNEITSCTMEAWPFRLDVREWIPILSIHFTPCI